MSRMPHAHSAGGLFVIGALASIASVSFVLLNMDYTIGFWVVVAAALSIGFAIGALGRTVETGLVAGAAGVFAGVYGAYLIWTFFGQGGSWYWWHAEIWASMLPALLQGGLGAAGGAMGFQSKQVVISKAGRVPRLRE